MGEGVVDEFFGFLRGFGVFSMKNAEILFFLIKCLGRIVLYILSLIMDMSLLKFYH